MPTIAVPVGRLSLYQYAPNGATASFARFFAQQVPKSPLTGASPPALTTAITDAQTAHAAVVGASLGVNTFEGAGGTAGTTGFSYTGGTATWTNISGSGNNRVVGASLSLQSAGRYNMTTGVPVDPLFGAATGHWLEAVGDFSYSFSLPVNSLSFYGTDFGDFDGSFSIEFYSGATLVFADVLRNAITSSTGSANGNLLWYAVYCETPFDKAVFRVAQDPLAPSTDFLGFDTLTVWAAPSVPVGTLTLTGYAPTIRGGTAIQVPLGVLTLSANDPVSGVTQVIDVPAGALTLTGFDPVVTVLPAPLKSEPNWYYVPGPIPQGTDAWLQRELHSMSRASLGAAPRVQYQPLAKAPDRLRVGLHVYADGQNWDPGSGEGVYVWKSDEQWHFLG